MNLSQEMIDKLLANAAPGTTINGKPWPPPVEPISPKDEKEFMAQVRDLLKRFGWRSYHTHNSRKSDIGFPDLVAVRDKRVVWIELKTERGIATAAQWNWIEDLKKAGQEVYLWRPSDWKTIVEVLT